jgi:hypothetical protein
MNANESDEPPKVFGLCQNCHWWFDRKRDGTSKRRVCIFHTGMRDEKEARMKYGGQKPLTTLGDFGCNEWQKDERVESA